MIYTCIFIGDLSQISLAEKTYPGYVRKKIIEMKLLKSAVTRLLLVIDRRKREQAHTPHAPPLHDIATHNKLQGIYSIHKIIT